MGGGRREKKGRREEHTGKSTTPFPTSAPAVRHNFIHETIACAYKSTKTVWNIAGKRGHYNVLYEKCPVRYVIIPGFAGHSVVFIFASIFSGLCEWVGWSVGSLYNVVYTGREPFPSGIERAGWEAVFMRFVVSSDRETTRVQLLMTWRIWCSFLSEFRMRFVCRGIVGLGLLSFNMPTYPLLDGTGRPLLITFFDTIILSGESLSCEFYKKSSD